MTKPTEDTNEIIRTTKIKPSTERPKNNLNEKKKWKGPEMVGSIHHGL